MKMIITNFLICDDIRTEIGSKYSLIGIYDDLIVFNETAENKGQWPKVMKLGVFARFKFVELDKALQSFKIKIDYNNDVKELGQGNILTEKIIESNRLNIVFVHGAFIFYGIGEIKFIYEFYNNKNELIKTISPDFKLKVSEKII